MNDITPNQDHSLLRQRLLVGGLVVFLFSAVFFYFAGGSIVSTDDAYTQSARVEISANIGGRVTKVYVQDNQQVHRGEPLFAVDNRDFLISLAQARAGLANAKLQIMALKATYKQRQADLQAAEASRAYQRQVLERQKNLASQGIASQAQLEDAQHAFAAAGQKLNAVKQAQLNIRTLLNNDPTINVNAHPAVQQAQAMLERAQLNLSYTIVKAPMDGIVAKVDQLQAGDYVKAATPVFALISSTRVWVEANFKETELAYMRPGQKVTIDISAYPTRSFHGVVESISPGTGSSFSLLPAENATGNWVKIVQRLPVRISIADPDSNWTMHSGLSALVKVDTQHDRMKEFW